jgi:hypothetical protein
MRMIEPVLIEPEALYDDSALRLTLGVTSATLANARRTGMLRYSRRGKRTLYKGSWILAWLELFYRATPCATRGVRQAG